MTDEARAAAQSETAAMVDDWAAGGEQAEDRINANLQKGLDALAPGWEDRAEALGLSAHVARWSDADWAAVDAPAPEPEGIVRWTAPDGTAHVANVEALMRQPVGLRRHTLARLPAEFVTVLKGHGVAA